MSEVPLYVPPLIPEAGTRLPALWILSAVHLSRRQWPGISQLGDGSQVCHSRTVSGCL